MDTLTELCIFGTLFLRFSRCVAKREWEYSMVFTVSNAHHTFLDKVCFVMIFPTFLASVGEPFSRFSALLGTLFAVWFFTTSEGTRLTARELRAGCGGPKTITSMTSLRARTDPDQVPKTQGPKDKRLRQV